MTKPGDTILETLRARGMTQTELARRVDRPIKTINEIIRGKTRITEYTALDLEKALGAPAEFWMSLEMNFRLYIARKTRP